MHTVSIHEAKTHLSNLIASVERLGEPVVICRHGYAVAQLVPAPKGRRTATDPTLSKIRILQDPTLPTAGEWEDV